jgi:hypothetical protein
MHRARQLSAVALAVAAVTTAPAARALEDQWHLGAGAGAGAFADEDTTLGPLFGLHSAYGLDDMFDARLEALFGLHERHHERLSISGLSAGLSYKVDIIEWVPYFGVQFGVYHLGGPERPGKLGENELGMSIDLGLDYALTRSVGLGAQLRFHGFLGDPLASLGDAPYLSALLRAEYRWGW